MGLQAQAFDAVLERQDPRDIAQAREKIAQTLDQFEYSPLL